MGAKQSFEIKKGLNVQPKKIPTKKFSLAPKDTYTLIALKNQSSYLMSRYREGLILVENGSIIWRHKASPRLLTADYLDVLYIPKHNCYLFCTAKNTLYRKNISKGDYFQILKTDPLKLRSSRGNCIQYSETLDRLILLRNKKECILFNLSTRKIEYKIERNFGNNFADYLIYSPKRDKVLAVTDDRWIMIYDIGAKNPKIAFKYRIQEKSMRAERGGPTVSVCQKNEYAFTQLYSINNFPIDESTNMLIFRLDHEGEPSLTLLAKVEVYRESKFPSSLRRVHILNRVDQDGTLVIFGESNDWPRKKSDIHFLEFVPNQGRLTPLNGSQSYFKANYSRNLFSCESKFYSISGRGKLIHLNFNQT